MPNLAAESSSRHIKKNVVHWRLIFFPGAVNLFSREKCGCDEADLKCSAFVRIFVTLIRAAQMWVRLCLGLRVEEREGEV